MTKADQVLERLRERNLLERIDVILKEHHVLLGEVIGFGRSKSVVAARHEMWRVLHDDRGLSWPEVARLFGRKHDAIMHARCKRISARHRRENAIAERIARWIRVHDSHLADEIERGTWRDHDGG